MKRIMQGRTSIIISHRVSSAKLANHIIVLDNGNIVEQGTHRQLIKLDGAYKSLYDKQLATEAMEEAERAMAEQAADFEYGRAAAQLAEAAAQLRALRQMKKL